jgi:hypothetical protein
MWNMPFGIAVAKGWVNGVSGMAKFGRNPVASSANEDVWDGGGLYTWLSGAQGVTVASTSKGDIFDMQVYGLNSTGGEITETFTLDGDSDVTLTNTYWRLNRAKVLFPTTDVTNTGTIAFTSTDSTVMAQIQPGMGQTLMAVYTIPAGKTGVITDADLRMGAASKTGFGRLFMRDSTGAWQVKHTVEVVEGDAPKEWAYFPEIPALTDIRWEVNLSAGQTNEVSADFTIYLFEADS